MGYIYMSNLTTFDNIYANLSQSAYEDRPYSFYEQLKDPDEFAEMNYKITHDYDENKQILGGQNLPNNGVLYVHKDKDIITTSSVNQFNITGGKMREETIEIENRSRLLSDDLAGFKAYFLTDTPQLNNDTKNTYIAVKGSDGPGLHSLNDWIDNDAYFTLHDAYTPQGKLVEEALHVKLAEMREKAPNAKLNVTGHSLGSISSVQGLANLSIEELQQIGEVKVFHGPDTLKSLRKMGIPEEKIQILSKKITYYVNPFDMISMLNRDVQEQLGTVEIIVPFTYKSTLATGAPAHELGEMQILSDGRILTANENFHPELIVAGKKLSQLIADKLPYLKEKLGPLLEDGKVTLFEVLGILVSREKIGELVKGLPEAARLVDEFLVEYQSIMTEARQASIKWALENIPKMQEQLKYASGAERLLLRSQILASTGQVAMIEADDKVTQLKQDIEHYKLQVFQITHEAHKQAYQIATYLEDYEVQQLLSNFQLLSFWNDNVELHNANQLNDYLTKINKFSETLFYAIEQLETLDANQGATFKINTKETFSLNDMRLEER